jgi:integrase
VNAAKKAALWSAKAGLSPYGVWVGERQRGAPVTLRFRADGRTVWRSLRFPVRTATGTLDDGAVQAAYQAALDQSARLAGRRVSATAAAKVVTVADTWAILTAPTTGAYPTDSPYRRELAVALDDAGRILGADFPWVQFDAARLRQVTRAKAQEVRKRGLPGLRSADVLGTRLLTIATRLRDEGHLPDDTPIPTGRRWRAELKDYVAALAGGRAPEPQRARYTREEAVGLLRVAREVDWRLDVALALGAGLRLGQVVRARRGDLDLTVAYVAPHGTFTVHGHGNKRGTVVVLTRGQRAVVDRYLDRLTMPDDAPLLPGRRAGQPIHRRTLAEWLLEAERVAGVPHVPGRLGRGIRRTWVDEAEAMGATAATLQALGGWADERTPKGIYKDKAALGDAARAAEVRARIMGEDDDDPA